jgi:hypothetical protein
MARRLDRWWLSGAAIGLAVVAVLVLHWRVPQGGGEPGVDVRLLAAPTGELAVSPVGAFVTATGLTPSSQPSAGRVTIRNQTAKRLSVAVELTAASTELDDVVAVRLTTPATTTGLRRLRELHGDQPALLHLAPGQEETVTVAVSVVPGLSGYGGRAADVAVRLVSTVEAP